LCNAPIQDCRIARDSWTRQIRIEIREQVAEFTPGSRTPQKEVGRETFVRDDGPHVLWRGVSLHLKENEGVLPDDGNTDPGIDGIDQDFAAAKNGALPFFQHAAPVKGRGKAVSRRKNNVGSWWSNRSRRLCALSDGGWGILCRVGCSWSKLRFRAGAGCDQKPYGAAFQYRHQRETALVATKHRISNRADYGIQQCEKQPSVPGLDPGLRTARHHHSESEQVRAKRHFVGELPMLLSPDC